MEGRLGLACRIRVARARPRRGAPRIDALVAGHHQHPQHVGPIRHEDRVADAVFAQHRGNSLEGFERRTADVLHQDAIRRHAAFEGVGASDGRLGRAVALELAARHDEVGRGATEIERDGMVEPGREDRRGPAVVLRRAKDDDRARRPRLVAVANLGDPERRVADEQGGPGACDEAERNDVPQDVAIDQATLRSRRRGSAATAGIGRSGPAVADLIGRGTSCISAPSRTSRDRCGRSAHRLA